MSKVRVACFSVSVDGYGAGPSQDLRNPLGFGGHQLHEWFVPTHTFKSTVLRQGGGTTGVDDEVARRGMEDLGAWILGRNMFAPSRGKWPNDDDWRGWWGDEPPYHTPVFVLTHHAREPLEMKGGTTFYFVTGGIEEALRRAKEAAGGAKDVRIGGGAATVRQYLRARLVDEMHVVIAPVLLGTGEPLFADLDLHGLGYRVKRHLASEAATHIFFERG